MAVCTAALFLLAHSPLHAQSKSRGATSEDVLFENDLVRVVKSLRIPYTSAVEAFPQGGVVVYLNEGRLETINSSGKKAETVFPAGFVRWSPPGGGMLKLTTPEPVSQIQVELKKATPGAAATSPLDPLTVVPEQFSLEFANERVRVLRFKSASREVTGLHEHALPLVAVYLTQANIRVIQPDGTITTIVQKPGEARWDVPTKHTEDNLNEINVEALMIEVR